MEQLKIGTDEFSQLRHGFMGGHTHAGAKYIGKTIERVASYDICSSYPSVMLYEKFPMSRAIYVHSKNLNDEKFMNLLTTKACLFNVILKNVKPKLEYDHPISRSKCFLFEPDEVHRKGKKTITPLDNGRVVRAKRLGITVTEQDFFTYSEYYDFDVEAILDFRYYEKQYLPHNFVKAILELYHKKTTLKDVVGEEVNYRIHKEMLNASYGMAVTNPVRDEFNYEDNVYRKVKPVLEDAISKYNDDVKRFLFYPWGVWVTAYARRNLFKAITAVGNDFIYADTDSVKFKNPEAHEQFFKDYNNHIIDLVQKSARYHSIETSKFSPLNSKGKIKLLGAWEFEGIYDQFKTLGAKRYFYQIGDKYFATVAGANKAATADYLSKQEKPFEAFNEHLIIPKEYSKRMVVRYIDDETFGWVTDYKGEKYYYHEMSSIHMEPTAYSISISDSFYDYLREVWMDGFK